MPVQPLGPTGLLAQSMTLPAGSQSLSMGGMGLRAQGMDGRKKGTSSHWLAIVGNSDQNVGLSIAADGSGNALVVGSSSSITNPRLILKLDANGQPQWSNTFTPTGNPGVFDMGIATDQIGNSHVVSRDLSQSPNTLFYVRFGPAGAIQFQRSTNGDGSAARGFRMALSGSGNVYAAGQMSVFSPITTRSALVKYNSSGGIDWARLIEYGGSTGPEHLNGLALDSSENAYVCGFDLGYIAKINSSGAVQFQKKITGLDTKAVAASPSGQFYIAGGAPSGAAVVVCFDSSGNEQWARSLGSGAAFNSAALDTSGNVYVCGTDGNVDVVLAKYSPAGRLLWQRLVAGPGSDKGYGITVSGSDVYFTGETSLGAGSGDVLVGKIPDDGSKTGAVGSLSYSVSNLADAAWSYAETSASVQTTTITPNNTTPSYTTTAIALATSTGRL